MYRKLLLSMILLLPFSSVRIQAEGSDRDDIHIRITEAGIQKTSADDIVLSRMLPGDGQSYTLRVDNRSKEEQELYLKLSTGEGQLAEILELQVTQDGHHLYEGTMQDAQSGIAMGRYAPQEMTTIRITLRLPKETDNAYSIREAAVDVELTAQMVRSSVATGDGTQRTLLISGILASISFLIIIVRRRRKDHEEAR
ncbi:LPXTG cell wall anchor domain-containing protein [[Clostridium] innocuum]|nr:LPXTG cell wall anchor domain-containing protein [[Clostridium] innocuum]